MREEVWVVLEEAQTVAHPLPWLQQGGRAWTAGFFLAQ